jgi:hypothetical protein
MNIKTTIIRIFLVLAILVLPTGVVLAQSPGGDVILFGQNYTLQSGETLNGSLVVFGGNILIEEDAKVNGDIVLIGGNLNLAGSANSEVVVIGGNASISDEVNGDIVLIGGQVNLASTSVVKGDVVAIGGQVNREPGAQVSGNVTINAPPISPPRVDRPGMDRPNINVSYNPFWEISKVFGRALAVAFIGMLLSLFLQPQLDRVARAIVSQPLVAGGYGLLAVIAIPVAVVITAITIILIPIALLIALIAPLAWVLGMVALGQEVGERFTKAINQTWAPVLTIGFGTFILVLVVGLVGMVPCVGWLASFLVTLAVLGGVAMTLFGSRNAPGAMIRQPADVDVPPTS